jgi:hypothetical protein
MQEFYTTLFDLQFTDKTYTIEFGMFDGATTDDARRYIVACVTARHLILGVWTAEDVKSMIDRGEQLPPELDLYFNGAPPPDPFDSGKMDQDGEDDYDDGDEWKRLLT